MSEQRNNLQENKMGIMPEGKLLASMATPMMISMLVQACYNIVDSIFVAIGQQPENEPFKDVVKLNEYGYIVSGESCIPESDKKGIFTAGDCRTKKIRQIATAISDGATAALEACNFVDSL